MSYEIDSVPELSEVDGSWNDEPVRYHGADIMDRVDVWPGRRVAMIPGVSWPFTPETCTTTEGFTWWLNDRVLLCNGCGLDGT